MQHGSVNVFLLESETEHSYTAYRYHLGAGTVGWLTGIRNMTLGSLWFPRLGSTSYDIHDPSTVRLDSFQSMSPENIAAVFGSPIPPFPIEIVALSDYVNPHLADDGTDSEPDPEHSDWGDDVSPGAPPPDLVYMEVTVDYLLSSPVEFNVTIHASSSTRWLRDDCGQVFVLSGDTLVLTATADSPSDERTTISTTYNWHVVGAQLIKGTNDVVGYDQTITLSVSAPGTVSAAVEIIVTKEAGKGIQVVTESGKQSSNYVFAVLTQAEADLMVALCKVLKHLFQIREIIFPGDPARQRYIAAAERQLLTSAAEYVTAASGPLLQRLNEVTQKYIALEDKGRAT